MKIKIFQNTVDIQQANRLMCQRLLMPTFPTQDDPSLRFSGRFSKDCSPLICLHTMTEDWIDLWVPVELTFYSFGKKHILHETTYFTFWLIWVEHGPVIRRDIGIDCKRLRILTGFLENTLII